MTTVHCPSKIARRLKALSLGVAFGLTVGAPVQAAVDMASVPLFLTASVDPNLMFVLDDSGSMHWEIIPEDGIYSYYTFPRASGIYGGGDYYSWVPTFQDGYVYSAWSRSPQTNKVYYNPAITYQPWSLSDGSLMPNATPTAAYHSPINTGAGTRNLTVNNTQNSGWDYCTAQPPSGCSSSSSSPETFYPAVYFYYNGGGEWTLGNYTKVEIRSSIASYSGHDRGARTDCTNGVCTYAQEIQNFANWYTYYRSRVLAARAGIGRAFSEQGEGMRVGFGAINKASSSIDGVNASTIIRGVRPFQGADRQAFFDTLYNHVIPTSGTPLRRALDDAGLYFSRTDNAGPWGAVPGTDNTTAHLQCRQSYTILMTDGYWNGDQAGTAGARADVDGTGGPTITGPNSQTYTYSAVSPFVDSYSNTLADVAMYYWKQDLRGDLTNRVPITQIDPAFWQHMVTFGVGLGVTGTVNPSTAFAAIDSGASITWPDPTATNAAKLDDLLHASVNGRGGFFNAADPITFANELSNMLDSIVARVESSSTSAAASSATLQSDTLLYTAGFRSTDWSGQLQARQINRATNGTLSLASTPAWDAESVLRAQVGSRSIFTMQRASIDAATQVLSGTGVALSGALHANQQAALNRNLSGTVDNLAANRISWLYGNENASTTFRSRSGSGEARLLGDIVGSSPQFAGKRDFGYRILTDLGASYRSYRSSGAYQSRPEMIYVAANDGMLHGFDARTGTERFAYMPSELLLPEGANTFAKINRLMAPDYTHRYFMDGNATVEDAYWGGSWKSVLVGSMGAGGRTVYALNVTSPSSFGTTDILWEFTDPDLGYGVGKPIIVRMSNGDWAAVFGNGYNSANHKAVLYIVRLSDGQLLAKINTNDTADTAASPNGLAAPNAVLDPNTLSATTIYAGDLKGHLWRFDVSGNVSTWDGNSRRGVLFQAKDGSNAPQPITSAPEIELNPDRDNTLMVLFGTGSYFRTQDATSTQVQTLYGIFDENGAAVNGRNQLKGQQITWQGDYSAGGETYTLRNISDNALGANDKGWYLDLIVGNTAQGERVISKPVLLTGSVRDRVRFTTMIPEPDPCGSTGGRTGFLMDIMLGNGGRADTPVWDLNEDGAFDTNDIPAGCTNSCSGVELGSGEEATIIRDDNDKSYVVTGQGGSVINKEPGTPLGRQSWRQLR